MEGLISFKRSVLFGTLDFITSASSYMFIRVVQKKKKLKWKFKLKATSQSINPIKWLVQLEVSTHHSDHLNILIYFVYVQPSDFFQIRFESLNWFTRVWIIVWKGIVLTFPVEGAVCLESNWQCGSDLEWLAQFKYLLRVNITY